MEYQGYSTQAMNEQLDHSILSRQEQTDLLVQAKTGDREAVAEIVAHNQRLVRSIANHYYRSGMCGDQDLEDIVQWGNLGLLRAIDKWDGRQNIKFSSYALYWIRAFVRRWGIMKGSSITISFHASDMLTTIRRARAVLHEGLMREPTVKEIAEKAGLPETEIAAALLNQTVMPSIDAPIAGKDGDDTPLLREVLPGPEDTEDEAFDRLLKSQAKGAVYELPGRLRLVMLHRYGLDEHKEMTLNALALMFKVSKTTIQNDEISAIFELRKRLQFPSLNS